LKDPTERLPNRLSEYLERSGEGTGGKKGGDVEGGKNRVSCPNPRGKTVRPQTKKQKLKRENALQLVKFYQIRNTTKGQGRTDEAL